MKDIRLQPWTIEPLNGMLARVYHYRGFKCWLSEVKQNYPHASVYLYTLQHPNGYCQRKMDLAEVNKLIDAIPDYDDSEDENYEDECWEALSSIGDMDFNY